MRIKRRDPKYHSRLMEFVKSNCPPSLVVNIYWDGYGSSCTVRRPEPTETKWYDGIFGCDRRPVVARVLCDRIILNDPAYYSDFEDLIREYEAHTCKEVTLEYWESA